MDMSLPNISRVWPCCIRTPSANVARQPMVNKSKRQKDVATAAKPRRSNKWGIFGNSNGCYFTHLGLLKERCKYEYQSVPACRSAKEIILIVFLKDLQWWHLHLQKPEPTSHPHQGFLAPRATFGALPVHPSTKATMCINGQTPRKLCHDCHVVLSKESSETQNILNHLGGRPATTEVMQLNLGTSTTFLLLTPSGPMMHLYFIQTPAITGIPGSHLL